MFGIGMQELLIIGVVALLGIGPKRLPEVAQFLGKGYAKIKKATDDLQQSVKVEFDAARNDEIKKKYPHLAVEDKPAPGEGNAPATAPEAAPGEAPPAAEGTPEAKPEEAVPTSFGEGGDDPYNLSTPVIKPEPGKKTDG